MHCWVQPVKEWNLFGSTCFSTRDKLHAFNPTGICSKGYTRECGKCEKCGVGTYKNEIGDQACVSCPPGSYNDLEGQELCIKCPVGTSSNETGRSILCDKCPSGTYASEEGLTQCTECPAGHFNGQEGQQECSQCTAETYTDTSGMSECVKCEGGFVTNYRTHCGKTKHLSRTIRGIILTNRQKLLSRDHYDGIHVVWWTFVTFHQWHVSGSTWSCNNNAFLYSLSSNLVYSIKRTYIR